MKDITISISKALLSMDEQYKANMAQFSMDPVAKFKYRKVRETLLAINEILDPFGSFVDDMPDEVLDKYPDNRTSEFNQFIFETSNEVATTVKDILTAAIADSNN